MGQRRRGGGTDSETGKLPPTFNVVRRLGREWRVQNTNATGAVTLTMDVSGLTLISTTDAVLLVDTDGDFSTGAPVEITAAGYVGGVAVFSGVTLADQDRFTLATRACTLNPVVTSALDDGSGGTLREAVFNACPGSVITFAGSYTIDVSPGGVINIAKNLTIDGGANNITISGGNAVRIFKVTDNITANLINLGLLNGKTTAPGDGGAGIQTSGGSTVTIDSCVFTNNNNLHTGGAIGIKGAANVIINNSLFSSNSASWGGAIGAWGADASGTVTISNSVLYPKSCNRPIGMT